MKSIGTQVGTEIGIQGKGRSAVTIALAVLLCAPLSGLIVAGPVAATPVYDGHSWVGVMFVGTSQGVSTVSGSIAIPTDYPMVEDGYFVMISIFDNAGSYDQIGISGQNGDWFGAWAGLGNCGSQTTYGTDYDDKAVYLTPGLTYDFAMEISSSGIVEYTIGRLGTTLWSHTKDTGGTQFQRQGTMWCGLSLVVSYTVYEEIYTVDEMMAPYWGLDVLNNKAGGNTMSSWTWQNSYVPGPAPWTDNEPHPTTYTDSNGGVFIWNPWFRLSATSWIVEVEEGTTDWYSANALTIELNPQDEWSDDCGSTCDVDLIVDVAPPGWTVTLSPTSDTPDASISMDVDIPANEPVGEYYIIVRAEIASDYFTNYIMWIDIVPPPPSGGTVGCLGAGTKIMTPGVEVNVEDLDLNDPVLAWDLGEGELIEVLWTSVQVQMENYGVALNDELIVSGWGQRIYARTTETTGWVNNAIELSRGDQIFSASEGEWVELYSIVPIPEDELICILNTDGVNNFIAGGFLLGGEEP